MYKIIVPKFLLIPFFCLIFQFSYGQTCNSYDDDELAFSIDNTHYEDVAIYFATHGGTIKESYKSRGVNLYLIEFNLTNNPQGYTSIEEAHDYFECNQGINNTGRGRVRAVDFNYDISADYANVGSTRYQLDKYNPYASCSKEFFNNTCPINQDAITKIAVVDAGHQWNSPFDHLITLQGAYDFVDNDFTPNDISITKHGVKVESVIAGIIASHSQNATILPIKILDEYGATTLYTLYKGILKAIEADVHVINLSVGAIFCGPDRCSSVFNSLMDLAKRKNILVSGAAGNDGRKVDYPNGYYHIPSSSDRDNLIISGSVNCRNRVSSFSNYGTINVDLFTLGENIPVYPNSLANGTSFAAPQISALATLMGMGYKHYQTVKTDILDNVDNYNLPCYSGGVLNATESVGCSKFSSARSSQQDDTSFINQLGQENNASLKANFLSSGLLSITISAPTSQASKIRIIGLSGTIIKEMDTYLVSGNNSIQINDLQYLSPGLYIIQAQVDQAILTQKSIKRN